MASLHILDNMRKHTKQKPDAERGLQKRAAKGTAPAGNRYFAEQRRKFLRTHYMNKFLSL
ncbi:hypothetical protein C7I85_25540 [Mesorhizobium soli]|uniref:Uncharacterized protein n=1 Tax=Pseudaminobacter soli (ex Li et al. 2025) TaxID=1295366 RepID=A0A2P7S0T7_9HYPH|nr:hypothetical protein C7I85_25540 [Mesorhizobium soli]